MFLKKQPVMDGGHPEVSSPHRRDGGGRSESLGFPPGLSSADPRPHGQHRGPKAQCTGGPQNQELLRDPSWAMSISLPQTLVRGELVVSPKAGV